MHPTNHIYNVFFHARLSMDTCHSLLASVKQHCIMVFLFFAFGIGGVFIVFSRVDRPGRYTKVYLAVSCFFRWLFGRAWL
jgi:hypothetical protein